MLKEPAKKSHPTVNRNLPRLRLPKKVLGILGGVAIGGAAALAGRRVMRSVRSVNRTLQRGQKLRKFGPRVPPGVTKYRQRIVQSAPRLSRRVLKKVYGLR